MWRTPRTGGLLALAVVIAGLPLLLSNGFHYNVAILVGFNAIICIGLNLMVGYAGQISLGHAAFIGIGAYGPAILTGDFGWTPVPAMLASAVFTGVIAAAVGWPILKLKGHYLAMATLGLGIIAAIILNTEVRYTGGPDGTYVSGLTAFGTPIRGDLQWYWLVGGLLWLTAWLALNLIDSPAGRALRAIHGSEAAAQVLGVDTKRYKVQVFVISAMIASLVGSLMAFHAGFATPGVAGFFRSIELVVMVVFGGLASIFGAIVGAAILTVLPQFLTVLHEFEHLVFGVILMATVIFVPRGVLPTVGHALHRALWKRQTRLAQPALDEKSASAATPKAKP